MKKLAIAFLAFAMVFVFASCENKTPAPDWNVSARIAETEENGPELASVEVKNGVLTVTTDVSKLTSYQSATPEQGNHKWIGILISTGADDLTKVKFNNQAV